MEAHAASSENQPTPYLARVQTSIWQTQHGPIIYRASICSHEIAYATMKGTFLLIAIAYYFRLSVVNWSVVLLELAISSPIELDETVSYQNKTCTDFPECTSWTYWLRFHAAKYTETFLTDRPIVQPTRVQEYSEDEPNKDYSKPFVLRGAAMDLATSWGYDEDDENLAYDYLKRRFGDKEIYVYRNTTVDNDVAADDSVYYTTLRQYVNSIQKNKSLLDYNIFEDSFSEEYMDELYPYVSKVDNQNFVHTSHLFFGNKNSGSKWHYAHNSNVFIEIYGVKRWCFIDIHEWIFMRAYFDPFMYARQRAYLPYLEKIPKSCVSLYPGDILYNPPWTWHQVQNSGALNLGVANRVTSFPSISNFLFPYDLANIYMSIILPEKQRVKTGLYILQNLIRGNENTTVEDHT